MPVNVLLRMTMGSNTSAPRATTVVLFRGIFTIGLTKLMHEGEHYQILGCIRAKFGSGVVVRPP